MHTYFMQKSNKNKPSSASLFQILPEGLVVNRKWLKQQGFDRPSVDYYLRSGKLEAVARGAYRRPGPPLKWEHLVYSLQEMGFPVHVGGRSALDLKGFAHHLPMKENQRIKLFGVTNLPAWIQSAKSNATLIAAGKNRVEQLPRRALETLPFGHWDWELKISSVELALLELMVQIKEADDFSVADVYFESATVLRPDLVHALLQSCTHIKAKRLFLWFSKRHAHQWTEKLNAETIDLGSGKRMIVRGGALDAQFQITVPERMKEKRNGNPIF